MNGFVADKIPDENAIALICAIVEDAVHRYARAILNMKHYEDSKDPNDRYKYNHAYMTASEIESFFTGTWFMDICEFMNIDVSGKKLIKQIKRSPKRFCNEHGGRRRKNYD